jgi:ankyrin repeat protein
MHFKATLKISKYRLFKHSIKNKLSLLLIKSIVNGHINIVKILLSLKSVNPNINYSCALGMAAQYGHKDILKLLLKDKRVKTACMRYFPFLLAAEHGQIEIIKILLKHSEIDPSEHLNTSILAAYKNKEQDIVKLLFNDSRVKKSLKNTRRMFYNKLTEEEFKNKIEKF